MWGKKRKGVWYLAFGSSPIYDPTDSQATTATEKVTNYDSRSSK